MVRFGKWYIFKCFSPYIKPLMVSWSPFFILHRLRSFRTCSVGWHSFIVRSTSSFPTFLPGKLAISMLRCSKVRFRWPTCFKTLFSQRSISIESKKWSKYSTLQLYCSLQKTFQNSKVNLLSKFLYFKKFSHLCFFGAHLSCCVYVIGLLVFGSSEWKFSSFSSEMPRQALLK